ncbi:MAG TPA: dethiobiotin synthase [Thermoleophilaceae bacterium]|jgi:dethiobiotin synthetase|nr:dethiobiotin synthase [Thermoleophilaceae bacterium]
MRGVFVTGTDTEVGKSVLAAAICAALVANGRSVAAFKPVVTGLDERPGPFGHDHDLLARATGGRRPPEEVAPYRFGPPASPHLAAECAGAPIDPARLVSLARDAAASAELLVVEGVGGLLVPLTPGYLVRDFAVDLALPVLVAARPALGTINHTLLTLEAARAGGLTVTGVVMTPWPDAPSAIERSNRATVQRLGRVPAHGLPRTDPATLGEAGGALPLGDWL